MPIEDKVDEIADNLYKRIFKESGKIVKSQMAILGVEIKNLEDAKNAGIQVTHYPYNDRALATYEYKGKTILGVRISESRMGVEFDVPNLETQEREVHNV